MSLERLATPILLSIIVLTIVSLVYYEVFHYGSSDVNDKLKANRKQFTLLNETLSILRNELQSLHHEQGHSTENLPTLKADSPAHRNKALTPLNESLGSIIQSDREKFQKHGISAVTGIQQHQKKKRALLYTMDSISSYETASKQGGAAGEILIRHSLENVFSELNVHLDVMTTDIGTI